MKSPVLAFSHPKTLLLPDRKMSNGITPDPKEEKKDAVKQKAQSLEPRANRFSAPT